MMPPFENPCAYFLSPHPSFNLEFSMRPFRLAFAALLIALPAAAQTHFSFAPQIGIYIPTEKLQSLVTGNPSAPASGRPSASISGSR